MPRWLDDLQARWRALTGRERRRWVGDGRLYLQAREPTPVQREAYARAIPELFRDVPGVRWARYNAVLGRVVIAFDEGANLDRLAITLDALDVRLQLDGQRLRSDPLAWDHDSEHLLRLERAIDLSAAGLGLLRKLLGSKRRAGAVDLSAVLTVLSSTPALRRTLERRFGEVEVDVALGVGSALVGVWGGTVAAPLSDMLSRELRLRALRAQRRAWATREPELGAKPEDHVTTGPPRSERPCPVPPGPIEEWSRNVVPAGLGAFGLGLTTSRSVASASAPLFGAAPKAAQLARRSFVNALVERLAAREVLVRNVRTLDVLDRIDTLVVGARTLDTDERLAAALMRRARELELRLLVHGEPRSEVPAGLEVRTGEADALVQELLAQGRVVATIGLRAVPSADFRVGESWDADVVLRRSEDVLFLVDAIDRAHLVSRHGVQIATVQSVAALLLSVRGLSVKEASRIALGSAIAGAVALVDGVRMARSVEARGIGGPVAKVPWHAVDREEALAQLESSRKGLSAEQVAERRPVEAPEPTEREVLFDLLLEELDTPLTPMLFAGAGLSALTGALVDAFLIASVMGLDAVLGATQRRRTERELASLAEREARQVRTWRSGEVVVIDASELVVGDVIQLEAGERVPADCRLLKSHGLEAEEASLTGESTTVAKSSSRPCDEHAPVAERHTMLYEGTTVAAGSGLAVVVTVGEDTESQRGMAGLGEAPSTGVERRLARLTSSTTPVAVLSGLALLWSGMARGRSAKEVIGAAISLAVAAVPEGLPVLATMAQLAAAKRLAQRGALVTNPRAVEALGRVSVLCADKTGTLTEGRLALKLLSDGGREAAPAEDDALDAVLLTALRAGPAVDDSMAHPTDRAIHGGATHLLARAREPEWLRLAELPFEPERGFHAVLGEEAGERWLCMKGEPEKTLARCLRDREGRPLGEVQRRALIDQVSELAGRGLRVLAVARGPGAESIEGALRGDLSFVGLIGLADPVRPTARDAIHAMGEAGVKVTMITGDHPLTARAIATELGIEGDLLTGQELEGLDDEALAEATANAGIYARVTPSQKVRIVRAYQRRGHAVAMTGDGANDAPAIRLADVGVALGERATGAARTAADLVVADERVETIVEAILEGRALWTSVRDAVSLLVGGNLGEIFYTLTGGLATGRSPLNARQLLLINMLTDTIPAIAIAVMPPTEDAPERLAKEGPDVSLGESLARDVGWRAAITGGAASLTWLFARPLGTRRRADTVALLTLVGGQLGQMLLVAPRSKLVTRSSLGSLLLLLGIVETPGVSHFFGCKPLGPVALFQAAVGTLGATLASRFAPRLARRLAPRVEEPAHKVREELGWWLEALSKDDLLTAFSESTRRPRRRRPKPKRTNGSPRAPTIPRLFRR